MEKIDLKKNYAHLYKAKVGKPQIVEVPELQYLMIDGVGDPNTSQGFTEAIEALYSLSYTLKFTLKKGPKQIDFGVMPLEGLWWTDDMNHFSMEDKSAWKWTLMILMPDFITPEMVEDARTAMLKKKNPAAISRVRLEKMNEGLCAQTLYVGPYSEEPPTIVMLHNFIEEQGHELRGKHREIYLSDMRRTAPEKLKTVIRQPVL